MLNEMMHRPVVKPELVEYMRSSQRRFPGDLGELENTANELGIPIIPHETAVFLDFIVGLYQPKNILEIGTAVGFSASLMATASPQAKVTTIDRYELMYSRAKANFERLGLADRINVIGHARQSIPLRMTIEIAQRQLIYLLCNSRPQPLREILDNRTDDKGLPVVEQGSDCIEHGQQQGNLRHSFQINTGSQTIRNEIGNFF